MGKLSLLMGIGIVVFNIWIHALEFWWVKLYIVDGYEKRCLQ